MPSKPTTTKEAEPTREGHARRRWKASWPYLLLMGVSLAIVVLGGFLLALGNVHKTGPNGSPSTLAPNSRQNPQSQSGGPQCKNSCSGPENQSQGSGQPPVMGAITAVSSTSISVRPSDGGAVKTFHATGDTNVMSSGSSKAYNANDFHVGDKITVAPKLGDSTTADFIALDDSGLLNNVPE